MVGIGQSLPGLGLPAPPRSSLPVRNGVRLAEAVPAGVTPSAAAGLPQAERLASGPHDRTSKPAGTAAAHGLNWKPVQTESPVCQAVFRPVPGESRDFPHAATANIPGDPGKLRCFRELFCFFRSDTAASPFRPGNREKTTRKRAIFVVEKGWQRAGLGRKPSPGENGKQVLPGS